MLKPDFVGSHAKSTKVLHKMQKLKGKKQNFNFCRSRLSWVIELFLE